MLISPVDMNEYKIEPLFRLLRGSHRDGDFCNVLSIAGEVLRSCSSLRLSCISLSLIADAYSERGCKKHQVNRCYVAISLEC